MHSQIENRRQIDTEPVNGRSSAPRSSPALFFLILVWGLSGVMLSLPTVNDWKWSQKAFLLILPVVLTLVATLVRPREGFAFSAVILTFLVSQTGFQAQMGSITTSALEICIIAMLAVLLLAGRFEKQPLVRLQDLPGYKWLLAFITYSILLFVLVFIRHDSISNALIEFKGFLLYPLMIYLMLAGIKSERLMLGLVVFMGVWYAFVSMRAILDFASQNTVLSYTLYRASGEYAPVNIYGSSAVGIALVLFGIAFSQERRTWLSWFLGGLGVLLVVGAWTSLARSAMVALAAGVFFLAFVSRKRGLAVVLALVLGVVVVYSFLPQDLVQGGLGRLLQMSDSSTMRREFYLESGIHAFLAYWPLGAGWGNAFWYYRGAGLAPTGFIPWYHNDYLNLGVQTGLPGLLIYLGFWFSVLRACWQWLQNSTLKTTGRPYVIGGTAALVALLLGAMFEHFLWRPDMAGLVIWTAGIALAGQRLMSDETGVGK